MGHERQESDCLQRHRLATGVGSGDHQHPLIPDKLQVQGHHRLGMSLLVERRAAQLGQPRIQQWMARGLEHQLVPGPDRRLPPIAKLGKAPGGLEQIQLGDKLDVSIDLSQRAPHLGCQLAQYSTPLGLLLIDGLLQTIVGLYDFEGLEVEAPAGAGAPVHQTLDPSLRSRLEHQE